MDNRFQAIRHKVDIFLKNESYPIELRKQISGICKTLISVNRPNSDYILGGFQIIIEAINNLDNGELQEAFKRLESILTVLSNINPLERITNNRNSVAAIRVAVTNSSIDIDKAQLKRDSLYFDYFAFRDGLSNIQSDPELNWLNEQGIIQSLEYDRQFENGLKKAEEISINEMLQNDGLKFEYNEAVNRLTGLQKLIFANGLSEVSNFIGIPWFKNETEYVATFKNGSNSCLSVILKALPIPDDTTPWEAILDFRRNAESIEKRQSLIAWQNKLFKQGLSAAEIGDELQYLLNEYSKEMKALKIKTRLSTIKTIFVAVPELVENLAKLKFKAIAENVFAFAESKIDLNEKRSAVNGKEIAYIPYSRQKFGS